jgi:hypothetical protein
MPPADRAGMLLQGNGCPAGGTEVEWVGWIGIRSAGSARPAPSRVATPVHGPQGIQLRCPANFGSTEERASVVCARSPEAPSGVSNREV